MLYKFITLIPAYPAYFRSHAPIAQALLKLQNPVTNTEVLINLTVSIQLWFASVKMMIMMPLACIVIRCTRPLNPPMPTVYTQVTRFCFKPFKPNPQPLPYQGRGARLEAPLRSGKGFGERSTDLCVQGSPKWEKGSRIQSPSPRAGEGFRVRATKVECTLVNF
jgi:hypothetical protein